MGVPAEDSFSLYHCVIGKSPYKIDHYKKKWLQDHYLFLGATMSLPLKLLNKYFLETRKNCDENDMTR